MVQQRKEHTNYLIAGAFTVLILLPFFGGINLMIQQITWLGNIKFQGLLVFYYLNLGTADGRAGGGLKMSVWLAAVVQIPMLYVCFTVQCFI